MQDLARSQRAWGCGCMLLIGEVFCPAGNPEWPSSPHQPRFCRRYLLLTHILPKQQQSPTRTRSDSLTSLPTGGHNHRTPKPHPRCEVLRSEAHPELEEQDIFSLHHIMKEDIKQWSSQWVFELLGVSPPYGSFLFWSQRTAFETCPFLRNRSHLAGQQL